MIISASRRTDLPAFYARWFINRVRAGYCLVPNPFNPRQISRISLAPEDVDVIVFWTRHARPLFPYLRELDERGYRYYFQYTLMDNPRALDTRTPSLEAALDTFRALARRIGPQRVIWRHAARVSRPGLCAYRAGPARVHSALGRQLDGPLPQERTSLACPGGSGYQAGCCSSFAAARV